MDTIRERCLKALRDQLLSLAKPGPADPVTPDDYSFTWSDVRRGALPDGDGRKAFLCGIIEGAERKETRFPITECQLNLVIEFRMVINKGDQAPAVEANRILGEVQRCVCQDRRLGGLAIDLVETGNEIDLDSASDKTAEGVVFLQLKYRHKHNDPRIAI